MNKYIDAEKLKAEIERRLKDYWKICFHDVKAYNEDSNVRELKELLSFIHALEEKSEKPTFNLEKELKEYCKEYYNYNYPEQGENCDRVMPHVIETARHFYELGRSEKPKNNGAGKTIGKSLDDFIVDGKEIICNGPPIDDEPQFNLVMDNKKGEPTIVDLDDLLDNYFEKLKVPEHQIIFEDTYRKIATDFYNYGRNSL